MVNTLLLLPISSLLTKIVLLLLFIMTKHFFFLRKGHDDVRSSNFSVARIGGVVSEQGNP